MRLRALACTVLSLCAVALTGCSEGSVTHRPDATATATPFQLATLPPIGYNHRYGNNPVAAADAFQFERRLYARHEFWEVGLRTDPAQAGFIDATDPAAVTAARPKFTTLFAVIASESITTLRALVARGDDGQKTYCVGLVDQLRGLGYSNLSNLTVMVFFGENDHHATLTWTPKAGYDYKILDNNLGGALLTPPPSGTPFSTPPPSR